MTNALSNPLFEYIRQDTQLPDRAYTLSLRKHILYGSLYKATGLPYFHEDRDGMKAYVPEDKRIPAVQTGLALITQSVERFASFTFGEARFPTVETTDAITTKWLATALKYTNARQVFHDAAIMGSIGSVAIRLRVFKAKMFLDALDTTFLTPTFFADDPDTLEKVVERYKIKGKALKEAGYDIRKDDLGKDFWFEKHFTTTEEIWFVPYPVTNEDDHVPVVDANRSVKHNLGFVPIRWIKYLPGSLDPVDGVCLFDRAVNAAIQIDYRTSGADRALKYSSDPMLLLKDYNLEGTVINRTSGRALVVGKDGDAKILEMDGKSTSAVYEHVSKLREMVLEAIHGPRANPDKVSQATSGMALKLLYSNTLAIADQLRENFGSALMDICRMMMMAVKKLELIKVNGVVASSPMDVTQTLSLDWPEWFGTSADDKFQIASALSMLITNGCMSAETALRVISTDYEIEDLTEEMVKIKETLAAMDAREKALQPTLKPGSAKKTA